MELFNELDKIFNEVKDEEFAGFENLADGEYLVEIEGAELTTSKSEKPMVVTAFKVVYGEKEGFIHKVFHVLTGDTIKKTEGAVNRFARFAKECGADTGAGLQGTVQSLDGLKGQRRKLTLVTKDGWLNTNVSE